MKFNFNVFAKSVPGICIVVGAASAIVSKMGDLGGGLFAFGIFLTIAGIMLQIVYLISSRNGR
jgi:hypothetical protein